MTRDGETMTATSSPNSLLMPWDMDKTILLPPTVPILPFVRKPLWTDLLALLEHRKKINSCEITIPTRPPTRVPSALSADIQKIKLKSGRPLKKPSFPIKLIWCKGVVCLMDGDHEVPVTIDADNTPSDVAQHQLTHEEEYWYNCHTDSKKNRAKHYTQMRSSIPEVESMIEFICGIDQCMKVFSTRNEVVDHVFGTHHYRPAMSYKCCWPNCEREGSFAQFYQIEVHMLQHRQERPYRCQEEGCSKSYRRMENLRTHMRCHSGEKPYLCKFEGCNRAFTNASDRAKHENRTHSTEKMFVCEEDGCGKAYTDPSSLRKHMINAHGKERYEAHKMSKQHARKRKAEDALRERSRSTSTETLSPNSYSPDSHLNGLIRPEPVKRGFFVADLLQQPVFPSPTFSPQSLLPYFPPFPQFPFDGNLNPPFYS